MSERFFLEDIYGFDKSISDLSDAANQRRNQIVDPFLKSGLDLHNITSQPGPGFGTAVWQQFMALRILRKQDSLMTVPPGAGKTKPILYTCNVQFKLAHGIPAEREAWDNVQLPMGVEKTSREFPRLLYIGRTKQLAGEAFSQNMRGDKDYGLIKTILDNPQKFFANMNTKGVISREDENSILDLVNTQLLGISAGSIKTSPLCNLYTVKPIFISTPSTGDNSQLLQLIRNYGDYFNTIIIDESQDYMIKPGEKKQSRSDEEMFQLYIDIIRSAPPPGRCSIQLLTGTTNYETAKLLANDLNKCYRRNFEMPTAVVNLNDPHDPGMMFFNRDTSYTNRNDPSKGGIAVYNPNTNTYTNDPKDPNYTSLSDKYAGNRSNIKVAPYDLMASPEQKKRLIVDIVNGNQKNSIMAIFSVGRNTKAGIFRLLEDVLPFIPARDESVLYANHNDEKIAGKNMRANDFINQYRGEFIASKSSYNPKSEPPRNDKNIQNEDGKNININDIDQIQFLKYFDVAKTEAGSGDELYSNIPNTNNLVYQAALRGIGVILGKSDNRHKEVIQKLFRDGKLTLLLATDALGIGANVLAKHIYITSMEKPPMFNKINDSSLIQLANRVGRDIGKIPYAFVYVNSLDYPHVAKAMSTDPSAFTAPLNYNEMKKAMQSSCSVDGFLMKLKQLFS